MQFIMFTKLFQDKSVSELIKMAHTLEIAGYDLCVRDGYPVAPGNAPRTLPEAAKRMKGAGLVVPMVTGCTSLLQPDDPEAEPLLAAMDEAEVRLLKLGYFMFDPNTHDYWKRVEEARRHLEGWQALGEKYRVKICYHTHSGGCMGSNCAALMHLMNGFDPKHIGAFIDPGHLLINGESISLGIAMVRKYLSIVALKDVLMVRGEQNGHGTMEPNWLPVGEGMINWTDVFSQFASVGFHGPFTIHCEFRSSETSFPDLVAREVSFFKQWA